MTKLCALFLLLGAAVVVLPNSALAVHVNNWDSDEDGDDGRPNITIVFDYVITIDQDNGVNDSSCYPSSPGIPSGISCGDINFALDFSLSNNSKKFVLIPGKVPHYLKTNSFFQNAFNVALIGNGSVHSIIECASGAGLSFVNSTNVVLENVHFLHCGALYYSNSRDFTDPKMNQISMVSLYFYNCSDITMYRVAVNESRNAMGVVMYDTVGYNLISECIFYKNTVDPSKSPHAGGGGFGLEFTFCPPGELHQHCNTSTYYSQYSQYRRINNAHYVFYKCVFQDNVACLQNQLTNKVVDKFASLHHNETHELFGRGGGMVIYFKGESMGNLVEIRKCVFSGNTAIFGGAIDIGYKDNSMNNTAIIEDSKFLNNSCFQTFKYDTGGGGIVVASNLLNSLWSRVNNYTNHISVENSEFADNFCLHGGGLYYFLELQLDIAVTLNVSNCTFTSNMGQLGSAVKVSPYLNYGGTPPCIIFSNCTFERNSETDYEAEKLLYNKVGLGTMYIYGIPVKFRSEVTFLNNTSSAIGVANTDIDCSDANMTFIGNTGTDGGGIALVGAASILIGNNTNMTFIENHVTRFGGAIYNQYIGRELMNSSVKCFVHYSNPFAHPKDWISSFTFQDNTAKKLGNSIFTTSIFPCTWNLTSVFCSNKHWKFSANCLDEIFTEAYTFDIAHSSSVFPGKGFSLNMTAKDDLGHDVTFDTVYNAYVSNPDTARVDPRSADVTANYVIITGEGNQSMSLELETANSRINLVHVRIDMLQCPPGMIVAHNDSTNGNHYRDTCKCPSEDMYTFNNNLRCYTDTYSVLVIGFNWIGMLPDDNGTDNDDTLYMGAFPREFHHIIHSTGHKSGMLTLPREFDELDNAVCGPSNRTGILCGKCKEGHATAVNSLNFQCIPCSRNETNFALNIFAYLTLTFLPYIILFIIIVLCKLELTSSAANSFILFAQLLSAGIFPIDGNKLAYLDIGKLPTTQSVYTIIYGIFNLNSFSVLMHPFCVNEKFTTLDVLCLDYAMAAFPLLVIAFIRFVFYLKSRCQCNVMQRKHSIRQTAPQIQSNRSPKWSLLHAFVAFIFLSYTKFSIASMRILNSTQLFNKNGTNHGERRIFYAGHHVFTDKAFIFPYGIITLFVFIVFVLLPPFLLLGPFQFIDWLLDKPRFVFLQRYWPTIKIHAFMDAAFHGYKLNRRFFAGIYLLFRLSIFLNFTFNTNQTLWLLIQQFFCTIMMLLVAIFQPHQKTFFNVVDGFILLCLVILNLLSIYMLESPYDSFPLGVYIFEYVLVWLPLVYIVSFVICVLFIKYGVDKRVLNRELAENVSERQSLLRSNLAISQSLRINTDTSQHFADEDLFERAEEPNVYRSVECDRAMSSNSPMKHELQWTPTTSTKSASNRSKTT